MERHTSYSVVIIVFLFPCTFADINGTRLSAYQRMVNISDALLASHRKTIKPPIVGDVDIFHMNFEFVDLDEPEERLTMVMQTMVSWTYETLTWKPIDGSDPWNSYELLTFSEDDVWFPSLQLDNVNSRKLDAAIHPDLGMVTVFQDGLAFYTVIKTTETRCSIDATYYPFDEQVCDVIVGVRTLEVNLTLDKSDLERVFDYKSSDNVWTFKMFKVKTFTSLNGPSYQFRLHLLRRPTWAIVNIIVPIFVLVSLTPLVFLLPKDGGERMGLSLTILLAVSVYMTLVSDHLPMSSHPLPILTVVMFLWYGSNTMIVLLVILNIRVYKLHPSKSVPLTLTRFVLITRKVFCQATLHQPIRVNMGSYSSYMNGTNDNNDDVSGTLCDKAVDGNQNTNQSEEFAALATVEWKHVSSAIDKWLLVIIYVLKVICAIYVFKVMKSGQLDTESESWKYESEDLTGM